MEEILESDREGFAKKDNVGLDQSTAFDARGRLTRFQNDGFGHLPVKGYAAIDARAGTEMTVAFDEVFFRYPRETLQPINVLRIIPFQQSLAIQERQERMTQCGTVLPPRPQFRRQIDKGLGIAPVKPEVEDGFGVREVVGFEVVVEAASGRAEVGYAGGTADACPAEDEDASDAPGFDEAGDGFEGGLFFEEDVHFLVGFILVRSISAVVAVVVVVVVVMVVIVVVSIVASSFAMTSFFGIGANEFGGNDVAARSAGCDLDVEKHRAGFAARGEIVRNVRPGIGNGAHRAVVGEGAGVRQVVGDGVVGVGHGGEDSSRSGCGCGIW